MFRGKTNSPCPLTMEKRLQNIICIFCILSSVLVCICVLFGKENSLKSIYKKKKGFFFVGLDF